MIYVMYAVMAITGIASLIRLVSNLRDPHPNFHIQRKRWQTLTVLILITACVALATPTISGPLDDLLGGAQYANLLLRIVLYVTLMRLGALIAAAFDSMLVDWLVVGKPGYWALGAAIGVTVTAFTLGAYQDGELNGVAGLVYRFVWQAYMLYIALCLLVALLPAALRPNHKQSVYRVSAAFFTAGMILLVAYPFTTASALIFQHSFVYVSMVGMAAITLITLGTMTGWISQRMARRADAHQPVTS